MNSAVTRALQWPQGLLAQGEPDRQWTQLHPAFCELMQAHRLPPSMAQSYASVVLHLAAWVMQQKAPHDSYVLGLNGAQGSGKSTLSAFLALALTAIHHQRVAVISIDDLYQTRAEREQLARDIHPLLVTRGVPGTHDIPLGMNLLRELMKAENTTLTPLPSFCKASDERRARSDWRCFQGRPDIIVFEGWCVGTLPQDECDLIEPINRLEREEDHDGHWRRYVNQQLQGSYATLFATLDGLILLQVPDMARVIAWRTQQEKQLAVNTASADQRLFDTPALERFIMHYERLTRHNLKEMPGRADITLKLNDQHDFSAVDFRKPREKSH